VKNTGYNFCRILQENFSFGNKVREKQNEYEVFVRKKFFLGKKKFQL
jgi:hypothetical protein